MSADLTTHEKRRMAAWLQAKLDEMEKPGAPVLEHSYMYTGKCDGYRALISELLPGNTGDAH